MRVGLEHFGQSVLLLVSMTFLRSPVLAILAIMLVLPDTEISAHARDVGSTACPAGRTESNHPELLLKIFRGSPRGNRLEKDCDRGSSISLHDNGLLRLGRGVWHRRRSGGGGSWRRWRHR